MLCKYLDLFHGSISMKDQTKNENHEVIEIDRVNDSSNVEKQKRVCIISAHPEGFQYLYDHNMLNKPVKLSLSIRELLPWYYQRNDDFEKDWENKLLKAQFEFTESWREDPIVIRTTREMREKINHLVMYPSECIRKEKDIDVFDLKKMIGKDLRDVQPANKSYPLLLVDTVEKLHECVSEICSSNCSELAFDLEMYNPNKYLRMTYLLQLATLQKDYIVDVLAPNIWKTLKSCLEPIFLDPQIVKVSHGICGMDISAIHRDFGLFVVNVFDTCKFTGGIGPI